MNIILIKDAKRVTEASTIALDTHAALKAVNPWLPARTLEDFIPRIEWMTNEGTVYGLESDGTLCAFLGWFPLDNFRNLGPGALSPDWCIGIHRDTGRERQREVNARDATVRDVSKLMSPLFRRLLADVKAAGISVHAVGVPATEQSLIDECSLLGYGRIVLDAARPARDLLAEIPVIPREQSMRRQDCSFRVRSATRADASALFELDAQLARHIGEPPVLMPDAHGSTVAEWEEWLDDPDAVTFIAERAKGAETSAATPVGFIKADPPHMDVSWFVHGEPTLAICGLYVNPTCRGMNVGAELVRAIATHASASGRDLVSVDCETHNPEARAFWLSRFEPVSWSFERRF